MFENNPKKLYRDIRGNNIDMTHVPNKETLESFWKPIFEKESKYERNKKWLGDYENSINIEKSVFTDINVRDTKYAMDSFDNWKSPGVDNIQNYGGYHLTYYTNK